MNDAKEAINAMMNTQVEARMARMLEFFMISSCAFQVPSTSENITMQRTPEKNKMEPTNPNGNTFEKLHMSK